MNIYKFVNHKYFDHIEVWFLQKKEKIFALFLILNFYFRRMGRLMVLRGKDYKPFGTQKTVSLASMKSGPLGKLKNPQNWSHFTNSRHRYVHGWNIADLA